MQVKYYYCKKKSFDFRCARFISRVSDLIIFVNIVSSVSISIVSRVSKHIVLQVVQVLVL